MIFVREVKMNQVQLTIEKSDPAQKIYTIHDAAEILGVHQQTLRNWDRKKLVTPLRAGNRRIYTEETIERCRKIKEFSGRGISLKGVKELLEKIER
jgi:MerR family transcriptional regulator/heat shock protein HspR